MKLINQKQFADIRLDNGSDFVTIGHNDVDYSYVEKESIPALCSALLAMNGEGEKGQDCKREIKESVSRAINTDSGLDMEDILSQYVIYKKPQ